MADEKEYIPMSHVEPGDVIEVPNLGKRTVTESWASGVDRCMRLEGEVLKWCFPEKETVEWITKLDKE